MSVIANFLYNDEEDLRQYVTRYETNNELLHLPGPIMQIKEKKNKGPSYYLKINIPCPLSVWEKVFGMLMTDCSLVRKRKSGVENFDENDGNGGDIESHLNRPSIEASTMQAYKSAVVWYHEKWRVNFAAAPEPPAENNSGNNDNALMPQLNNPSTAESLDAAWERMIHGYKKLLAEKKERGIMSSIEGKLTKLL